MLTTYLLTYFTYLLKNQKKKNWNENMPKVFRFLVQLLLCYRFLISISILFFVIFWAFWEIPIRVRLLMFVRKQIDHFKPNKYLKYQIPKKKNDTPEQPTQSPHTHIENRTSPKPNTLSLSLSVHTTNYTNYQNISIYISTKSLVYPQNKTHISHLCIAETCWKLLDKNSLNFTLT